jgi:hypothetical protein
VQGLGGLAEREGVSNVTAPPAPWNVKSADTKGHAAPAVLLFDLDVTHEAFGARSYDQIG